MRIKVKFDEMRESFDSTFLPQTFQNEAGPSNTGLPICSYEDKKWQVKLCYVHHDTSICVST